MACSKIFSGELPELLSEIIQYFRNDFSTLYSCILVNRLWCRSAIPLLWGNPFLNFHHEDFYHIKYHKIRFIDTYLMNLNNNDKIKLNEFGINHLSLSNTLFNYPSFITHLDTHIIDDCIVNWVAAAKNNEQPLFTFINNEQNLDFIKFIYKSLIKIFIENEAKLSTFDVMYYRYDFGIIFSELVLQSQDFVCNIKNLNISLLSYDDEIFNNVNPLLEFLSFNCNSISSLYAPNIPNDTAINHLSQLIKSQNNLKKIFFARNFPYKTLLNSNSLNTLNTITFYDIDFKNIKVLNEVFERLNVLESIHIIYCSSLDFNFIQQIINLTKPFKLKSLFVDEMSESIELLLQKSGDYLENFGFRSFDLINGVSESQLIESELQLLELITRYCTKIKYFERHMFNQSIYSTLNSIENFNQNLNYLTIDSNCHLRSFFSISDIELSSVVLQNLGQILPFKLEYLELSLIINANDFEIFLKNSQNTFIKKLLFTNVTNGRRGDARQDDILLYNMKEYIMRKKRVKYFAFQTIFVHNYDRDELLYLKDEVKEFKLHNIVVKHYDELQVLIYELLKEKVYCDPSEF